MSLLPWHIHEYISLSLKFLICASILLCHLPIHIVVLVRRYNHKLFGRIAVVYPYDILGQSLGNVVSRGEITSDGVEPAKSHVGGCEHRIGIAESYHLQ